MEKKKIEELVGIEKGITRRYLKRLGRSLLCFSPTENEKNGHKDMPFRITLVAETYFDVDSNAYMFSDGRKVNFSVVEKGYGTFLKATETLPDGNAGRIDAYSIKPSDLMPADVQIKNYKRNVVGMLKHPEKGIKE